MVGKILEDTPETVQVVLCRPGPLTLKIIEELSYGWYLNFMFATPLKGVVLKPMVYGQPVTKSVPAGTVHQQLAARSGRVVGLKRKAEEANTGAGADSTSAAKKAKISKKDEAQTKTERVSK